ncbi:a-factor receptor [Serendipita sp. 396]|nr:a-factor receptor [Serendipita sp. 396]KAG8777246.1 a-factor receptor [Serendipita sp. 397]KAG8862370.1 a-factor receptor [Serendipita sp. 405]
MEHPIAPLGFSVLFPVVPVLCFLSFFCCMLLLPGIIRTKVFALIFYLIWVSLGSLIVGVNMCIWRNKTVNAPIYADIVARILHIYPLTLYLSILCFSKFTWNITRPAASRKVIDKRMRHNYIDSFLCIGIPLLWSPLYLITTRGRYMIIEDLGPFPTDRRSIEACLTYAVPVALTTIGSVYFNTLTAVNVWRARRSGSHLDVTSLGSPGQDNYRTLSTILSLKYMGLVAIQTIALPFGFLWSLLPYILDRNVSMDEQGRYWYMIFDIREGLRQLPLTYTFPREQITGWGTLRGFLCSVPVNGILFFILFGLDSEVLGIHRVWLQSLGRKISDMIFSTWTYATKIPWPSRGSSPSAGPEDVIPFQLEDITLAPRPPPIHTMRTKGHIARGHSNAEQLQSMPPLRNARTFRKEGIPAGLTPVRLFPGNRLPDNGGPRGASSRCDDPVNTSSSRCGSRNEASRPDYPREYSPPPYEPS